MTPEKTEQRGQAARQVLEHSLYDESWTAALKDLWNEWANSESKTPEERERLFWKHKGLMDARLYLEGIIEEGDRATTEMKLQREEDEK